MAIGILIGASFASAGWGLWVLREQAQMHALLRSIQR